MDDEQGPWWTRPPEPGPQAAARQPPPTQRRRNGGQQDVDVQYPPAEGPPVEYQPFEYPALESPVLDSPASEPVSAEPVSAESPTAESPAIDSLTTQLPPAAYLPPELATPDHAPAGYAPPELKRPDVQPVTVEPVTVEPVTVEPGPPPPPPPPAKPVVRRVAVVPPAVPKARTVGPDPSALSGHPHAGSADRTETLPVVNDDIFATFSGPLPQGPLGQPPARGGRQVAGGQQEPLDGSDGGREPHRRPSLTMPEPRVLLLAAAAGLVVLLIVIVALLSGGFGRKGDPDLDPGAAAGPSASADAAAELKGRTPDGLKQVSDGDAAAALRKAGQSGSGSIVEAWEWNDRNGRNLVVTSTAKVGARRTLRVIQIAGLDDDPRTLRLMRDPKLPTGCDGAGVAGFTRTSLIVRDLDSNDVAEVMVGWSSRCGAQQNESQIRLALLSDGDKYILRGEGVLGSADQDASTPDPKASRWPDGFLKLLTDRYTKLYS